MKSEKSFLHEIKNIFHSFSRVIVWWKNKDWIKIADTSFKLKTRLRVNFAICKNSFFTEHLWVTDSSFYSLFFPFLIRNSYSHGFCIPKSWFTCDTSCPLNDHTYLNKPLVESCRVFKYVWPLVDKENKAIRQYL